MNLLEKEIDGQVYQFKAGFDFLNVIDKTATREVEGEKVNTGLMLTVARIVDGDIMALVDCLFDLNINQKPRITKNKIQTWIEDMEDVDPLFDEVVNFLFNANVCKKKLKALKKIQLQMEEETK